MATFLTTANDDFTGNDSDELIYGMIGSDWISTLGGNDTVFAGTGDDTIFGSTGDDVLFGNVGSDIIYGGQGDDLLVGDGGNDSLYGGFGNDIFVGGAHADMFFVGPGHSIITDYQKGIDEIVYPDGMMIENSVDVAPGLSVLFMNNGSTVSIIWGTEAWG